MITTYSNFNHRDKRYFEKNYQISRTVPDKTISLREMITRYQTGGRVKSFEPVYLPEGSNIPRNFERMDLLERAQFAKELPNFIADTRGRLMTIRQAKERAEKEAKALADREKKKQERIEQALAEFEKEDEVKD